MNALQRVLAAALCVVPLSASAASIDGVRISASGGKSISGLRGQADTQGLHVELTHALSRRIELGLDFGAAQVWQPRSWFGDLYQEGHEKTFAASATVIGRAWLLGDARRRAFIELGTGPVLSLKKIPAATSRFNFGTIAGIGLEMQTGRRTSFVAGYRFDHISNGGRVSRNPGWNVSSLHLGVAIRR